MTPPRPDKTDITIRCLDGPHVVAARVVGALAVHQEVLGNGLYALSYAVTHVPSGIGLGPAFAREADALAAAAELGRLCDWAAFDPQRATPVFRKAVREILRQHGGVPHDDPQCGLRTERALKEFSGDLNGYGGEGR